MAKYTIEHSTSIADLVVEASDFYLKDGVFFFRDANQFAVYAIEQRRVEAIAREGAVTKSS